MSSNYYATNYNGETRSFEADDFLGALYCFLRAVDEGAEEAELRWSA